MKRVIFFDVDNVLVNGQTQKLLLQFLFKKRKIGCRIFLKINIWFLFYKLHLVKDTIKIREEAFKSLAKWDEKSTKILFKEFFIQEIKPRVITQSINIIQRYKNQGYEVILISASIAEIVDELKEYLSLKIAVSTKLEIIDSRYTGRIVGEVPYGENKTKAVIKLLKDNSFTLDGSYAYSDHLSDLPLLELVANPVVVNPDAKFRKIAVEKKWSIYDF